MRKAGEQTINYMERFASFKNLTEKFTIKYCDKKQNARISI
ncbi:MAG: hypothetical protein ABOK23_04390 [Candidatus Methanoperedens sp.]|nr:hypothetical protein [Candidatus Methanoperedens sp.]MCZ7394507.1 hypothetical protein [Candidatus Methanoperedens sp.]